MSSHYHQHTRFQRWWPAGVAALVLLLLVVSSLHIAHGAPTTIQAAAADPTAEPVRRFRKNPFPATSTMTETVLAVLADYERPHGAEPLAIVYQQVEVEAAPAAQWRLYLPALIAARGPSQNPNTNPTPTPVPPTPTAEPQDPPKPADIAVTLWPNPSIRVARNGTLAYEIRIKNYDNGSAERVRVKLPYDKRQMVVSGSQFSKQGDWISELTDTFVTVTFGPVAPDEYRTAKVLFRVNSSLPDNTVISMRASYEWDDEDDGGAGTSNWAPVLVGSGNDSASWVWVTVDPTSGPVGTTHHFFSDRFIPGEGIVTWLNTPTGVKALDLSGTADQMGRIWLDFKSSGLARGTYSLVLYGARSNLTGVATFYVQ